MATKQAAEKKEIKERKKRVPLGAQRLKGLVQNQKEGYVYRWVNDTPGRIAMALEGGYQFVTNDDVIVGEGEDRNTDLGSMKSQHGGFDAGGKPYKRYLMVIRKELYDEDQAFKNAELDEVDRAIRSGKYKNGDPESTYVPSSGIKMGKA